jgi:hypothetical protein
LISVYAVRLGADALSIEVLRGHFGHVVVALCIFHIALFLPIPILPIYWVNHIHFSDGVIRMGDDDLSFGSVVGGSWLAVQVSLPTALLICFVVRALAAVTIWKAG